MTLFNRFDDEFEVWRANLDRMFTDFMEELEKGKGRNVSRLEALRDRINRTIESAKDRLSKEERNPEEVTIIPATDIYETADAVILQIDIPGVEKPGVAITFENSELTVTAKPSKKDLPKEARLVMNEILYGVYKRRFLIPQQFDATRAKAEVVDGVLILSIPKAEEAKPKKIEIA